MQDQGLPKDRAEETGGAGHDLAGPRLGFAVKVLGRPGLRSHDARRFQSEPHLRVSLGYLRELFAYLDEIDVRMYRMASGLAPYATHPDLPRFHHQLEESAQDLADLGSLARRVGLRLSLHPSQYIVLNTTDDDLATRSAADIEVQATLLEVMGLDDDAVVVLHVGGLYRDRQSALERFARRWEALSPVARRRLVLENDDTRFGVTDLFWLRERIDARLVFDVHHHHCYNPLQIDAVEAARACLVTWQSWAARPKIHVSSPRTDWGFRHGASGPARSPQWRAHAEFVDPFAFISFYRSLLSAEHTTAVDVMLEAKAKDVALLQLRRDLRTWAPDLADQFGGQPGSRGDTTWQATTNPS